MQPPDLKLESGIHSHQTSVALMIVITVTNNGNNTADILYNVTYANGETHFQKYAGITIDSAI